MYEATMAVVCIFLALGIVALVVAFIAIVAKLLRS